MERWTIHQSYLPCFYLKECKDFLNAASFDGVFSTAFLFFTTFGSEDGPFVHASNFNSVTVESSLRGSSLRFFEKWLSLEGLCDIEHNVSVM